MKQLTFSNDARDSLARGIQKLSDAVRVTMGPKGRNVLLQRGNKSHLTKDGVSVANEVELIDTLENLGAQLVKEVAQNTANDAGDGTTTATVLANAIFQKALVLVNTGSNPLELKKGMDKACKDILHTLKENSKEVTDKLELEQVATISANGDIAIGKMIANAITEVGMDGIITVEESKGFDDSLEVVKGMEYNSGFLSPYFITDETKNNIEFENPYILLYNHNLHNLSDIIKCMEKSQTSKRPLLIVTDSIEQDSLNTLAINKIRKILQVAVIKKPGFGEIAEDYLKDLSMMTGATIIDNTITTAAQPEHLGECNKVIITKDKCTFIGTNTDQDKLDIYVQSIKDRLEKEVNPFMVERLKERIGKLTGGIGVIKVGAVSETELKEKKDRVDDALEATRSAQAEGIIIGGGCAFLKCPPFEMVRNALNDDAKTGYSIVFDAIQEPFKQINKNAGIDYENWLELIKSSSIEHGYNTRTGKDCNMFVEGIIDSYKVARTALTNAISVSGSLLSTECIISEVKE